MERLLHKKIEMIEAKIDAESKQAAKYGRKNQRQALNCLRRKKVQEKQLQVTRKRPNR